MYLSPGCWNKNRSDRNKKNSIYTYNHKEFLKLTESSQNKGEKKKDRFAKGRNNQTCVSPKSYMYHFKNSLNSLEYRIKNCTRIMLIQRQENEKVCHVQTSGPRARVLKSCIKLEKRERPWPCCKKV